MIRSAQLAVLAALLVTAAPAQRRPGPGADPFRAVAAMPTLPAATDGVPILVLDPEDRPLAGADVVVLPSSALRTPEGRRMVGDPRLRRFVLDLTARQFAVATALGTRYVTDPEGRTRIAMNGSAQVFVAFRRSLVSRLLNQRAKDREIEVVLPLRPTIEVLVRDARGRPARGVPLRSVEAGDRFSFLGLELPIETDRNGRAWVLLPESDEPRELLVAIASRRAPRVPMDRGQPRLELTLPPCGQLRVYARGEGLDEGRRITGGSISIGTGSAGWAGMRSLDAEELGDDFATFWWVGVDEPVEVSLQIDGARTAQELATTGPSIPGEMKVVRLENVAGPLERSCRLLGLDGEPLSSVTILWVIASPGDIDLETARTGRDGELSFRIDPRDQQDATVATAVSRGWNGESLGARRWTLSDLRAGDREDLGDVTLQPEPVLIAGRVVDHDGNPRSGITVRCVADYSIPGEHGSSMSSSGIGDRYAWHSAETDADGHFELRELNPARSSVTLSVTTEPTTRVDGELEYAVGKTDVTVVLVPAARLEGAFVPFPDDVSFDGTIRLVADDETVRELALSGEGARFDTDGVEPGRYAFEVRLREREEPAFRVEGIELVAGQTCRDPRLSAIDWAAFVAPVRLTVTDTDGRAITDALVMEIIRTDRGEHGHGATRSGDGEFVIWVSDAGSEVRIRHDAYRSVTIEKLTSDRTVAMEPRAEVRLWVKNLPELPYWLTLTHAVEPAGDPGPAVGRLFHWGTSNLVTGAPQIVRPDFDGRARLVLDVDIDWEVQRQIRSAGARIHAQFERAFETPSRDETPEWSVELTEEELASLQEIVTLVEEILDR